ncbi:hypothetical protein JW823_05910 [bacterium]|nr:hypothetical protein [candidate division CSSED10-310 bacterium]
MKSRYILTTLLKTRDAIAATASYTLRHDMGYESVLLDAKREDYWSIELDYAVSPGDSVTIMTELAEKTKVFVNPNKHRYAIQPEGTIHSAPCPDNPGSFSIPVVISSFDDRAGTTAMQTLNDLYSVGKNVRSVQSGVLWTLVLKAESLDAARRIAEDIAVTRSRTEGLLANPHYESILIL